MAVSILVTFLFMAESRSETIASVSVKGLSFISPDFDDPSHNNFAFIGASLRSSVKSNDAFKVDLDGFYAFGNSALSYLNIKEIYFTIEPENYSHFHIGRKLKNWSSLDSNWNLGFFQPQYRGNPLAPENQGLTGLFWDHDEDSWGISLFASPFFLPDQGPGYEIKNGQFQNTNPWFHSPPQNIKFQGQILPIDYNINRPATEDVVLRSVYATQLRFGEKNGFFSHISAAYKPAQQFAIGYTGTLVVNRAKIDLTPAVFNENLYAADFGYQDDWGAIELSVLHTKPQQAYFSNSANTPVLEDSLSGGPRFAWDFKPFKFEISYFDTQGGTVRDVGPDASSDRASLTQRYLFRQATQLQVNLTEFFFKKLKWESQFQYRFSGPDHFKQIRFKNKLIVKGPWSFTADIVLIDTADDATLNMNTYRNLDQLWIGASYDI